jgi:hypothetical protein
MNAALVGNEDIKPIASDGWEEGKTLVFRSGWIAKEPGKSLVFELRAKSIGVIYKKYNTNDMGRAEIRVDDGAPVLLEGHFPCYWGGYAHSQIIADDLPDEPHKVVIRFLEEHDPESSGKEFMVCGLLLA